jgi:hypothetical protein
MVNLFTLAAGNGPRLKADVESLLPTLAPAERASWDRLLARVEHEGRISVNMRIDVLLDLVTSSHYQNIYEWAESRAKRSPKPADEILRERLGGFYGPRVLFEAAFEDGERFRYGALNVGGVGAVKYGECCVLVADRLAASGAPVAYLRGDSLKTYVLPTSAVDVAAVERDAAPHANRQHLAALKHGAGFCHAAEDRWGSLLCSADEYIEAIFVGDLRPDGLDRVRMAKSDHELYFHFAFVDFRAKLAPGDRALVNDFARLLDHLDDHKIPLEVVDD